MKRMSIASIALFALVDSAVGLGGAEKAPVPELTTISVAAGSRPQASHLCARGLASALTPVPHQKLLLRR